MRLEPLLQLVRSAKNSSAFTSQVHEGVKVALKPFLAKMVRRACAVLC